MMEIKISLKIKKVNIKMDETIIKLVEEVNSYSIDRIKDKIGTKIHKEIEKLRKDDDQFSKKLERFEYDLWLKLLNNYDSNGQLLVNRDGNLNDLVKIYDSLKSLKFGIDYFTNTVNTN